MYGCMYVCVCPCCVVLLQIRKTLKGPDLYDSFLRCLYLFNEEIITRGELVNLVSGWLG